MTMANEPPTGLLIDKYKEIEAYIDQKEKALKEHLAPYREGMQKIEDTLFARLTAENAQSFKSAATGAIAYKQRWTSTKVADRDKWVEWVFNNWDTALPMLTNHVGKDAVLAYAEENKALPDGIGFDSGWKVIVRKG